MLKTLAKLAVERNFLKLTKGSYEKPTVNTILNGEKPSAFSISFLLLLQITANLVA